MDFEIKINISCSCWTDLEAKMEEEGGKVRALTDKAANSTEREVDPRLLKAIKIGGSIFGFGAPTRRSNPHGPYETRPFLLRTWISY